MKRLQRLRATEALRDFSSETEFTTAHLVQPLFAVEGIQGEESIPGLGTTKRQDTDALLRQVEQDIHSGVSQFLLFPIPGQKREQGFSHHFAAGVIAKIQRNFGNKISLWVDTCLCSYTSHGHCCLFHSNGRPNHEQTLRELAAAAKAYADAGASGVAPSDMMDGRVAMMRQVLNEAGHDLLPIMSYSTKFASNFYGPFRVAADSTPQFGDRKQYQIDVRNRSDALAASLRCAEEGADLLMVKPGMTAIDLIQPIRDAAQLPVGAYQVSGEYAALHLLAEQKLVSFPEALYETWQVFRRAGAQFIITYGARHAREFGIPSPRRKV